MIEQNILNAMLQTGVLAITIPVVLIVAWKMYTKRSLVPFWVGIMVFIAFSRMYLYVHYPTDVLGGAVVGVISGYIGYKVTLRMSRHSGMN